MAAEGTRVVAVWSVMLALMEGGWREEEGLEEDQRVVRVAE